MARNPNGAFVVWALRRCALWALRRSGRALFGSSAVRALRRSAGAVSLLRPRGRHVRGRGRENRRVPGRASRVGCTAEPTFANEIITPNGARQTVTLGDGSTSLGMAKHALGGWRDLA